MKPGPKEKKVELKQVEQYAGMGLTKDEIGRTLGMSHTSFYNKKRANPKIEEAIQKGRAKFKVFITEVLIKQAQGGSATAAIWLDKTRCGTKEPTIGVNLTGDLNANVSQETNDERARRTRAEMIKNLGPV
jgi:hypothetical protein